MKNKGWRTDQFDDGRVEVVPINDVQGHEGLGCECNPKFINEGKGILIHNAFDNRQLKERNEIN